MNLVFDRRARQELQAIGQWLEANSPGLVNEFYESVERLLASLELSPMQFGPIEGSHRRQQIRIAIIGKSKYVMIFRVIEDRDTVAVLCVQHAHRRPADWKARVDDFWSDSSAELP